MLRTGSRENRLVVMMLGSVGGILISQASCRADARVEGDAALLAVIREGLATAAAQHQRGSLVARVVERQPTLEQQVEIHEHVWDGGSRYWRYSGHDVFRLPGKPESVQSGSNSEMILRPDLKCWHFPENNYATIRRSPKQRRRLSSQDVLELHPTRCWYSYSRGKTTWDQVLDPADVPDSVSHFEVQKAGSDRVVILRHQPSVGVLHIEVSLAHGGNIVSYRAESNRRIQSGTYDWVEYSPGNWRLKETVQEQVPVSGSDVVEKYYRLEILKFDPQPRIPANRFQCSTFNLAEGTKFDTYDAQGNRIRGGGTGGTGTLLTAPNQKNLDELAEQLRSSGFATPERAP